MKHSNHNSDQILDETLAAIRNEEIDAAMIERHAERVWARIARKQTGVLSATSTPDTPAASAATAAAVAVPLGDNRSCADFQSMIPPYLGKDLSGARLLLFEDHTRECLACRRALKHARTGAPATTTASNPAYHIVAKNRVAARPNSAWKWAIAAMFAITIGVAATMLASRFSPSGEAHAASLQWASGAVYSIGDAESQPLKVGEAIKSDERIRTAKDARAVVRLIDGSLVEMKERSEFSVSDSSKGTTINLTRGDVIVQAAKQHKRHLYVSTNDCLVSVTGTIFAVGNGTKGSRVSVVEGEVHVDQSGRAEQILHSGDQALTNATLDPVPVKNDVSWSRDAERYTQLLAEFASLRKELNERVPRPGVRYSTRLLDQMPADTVLYAALPNLGQTISESYKVMQERINSNAALREWWERKESSQRGKQGMNEIIERVRAWGAELGDEIAVGALMNTQGQPAGVLALAELRDSANFRSFLENQINALQNEAAKNETIIHIIDDPLSMSGALSVPQSAKQNTPPQIFVWQHDDLIAVALDVPTLQKLATALQTPAANNFKATQFYSRVSSLYKDGAGLIVAADLQRIVPQLMNNQASQHAGQNASGNRLAGNERGVDAARQLGLFNLTNFILEQKETNGKTHSRAVLSFDDMHHGIQSWLAAPGPMGSLEYVSPDATVVTAFVVKNPVSLVDDLLTSLKTLDPQVVQHLNDFEHQHEINFRNDFAATLGGEFMFSVDGPVLPTPSWKMVFEVYDAARLQQTLERTIAELNKFAAQENRRGFIWEQADAGAGRKFYTLRSVDFGMEINYTFANGYMILAPSRALVERALRFRESGMTLLHSTRFAAALPQDGNANFSAIFYHNLAPLVEPLARTIGSNRLPKEQGEALKSLAARTAPMLAYARVENDGIIFATDTDSNSPFSLSPATLLGIPGAFGVEHILEESVSKKESKR